MVATTKTIAEGLLTACDDRRLLGFDLWPRQRDLLAAVEHGPRLHVWALGRRSGKTTMAALVGLWDCLLRPELAEHVRPGERRHAVCVATNLRQARLFVRAALSIVERSPLLSGLIENATDDEIMFANGTALSAFPCTSRGARGWPISSLLLDEAAFHVDNEGNIAAESIFRALAPATAQFGNEARLVLASTPWGSSGFFADTFTKAEGGELADARAFQFSTEEMNPTITPAFLEQERARDPDGFRSEYLAEFLGSGGAYLDPDVIRAAVTEDRQELPPTFGGGADPQHHGWIAGFDASFASDPAGLCIVGINPPERGRLLLGLCRAWPPPKRKATSFEQRREREDAVLGEVAAVCLSYRVQTVVIDQFASLAVADALRSHGLTVKTVPLSAASKSAIFAELRARLLAGSVELLDDPDLLRELRLLRTKYAGGAASVVTPRTGSGHCDRAVALALATWEHRHGVAVGPGRVVSGREGDLVRAFGGGHDSGQLTRSGDEPGLSYSMIF